MTNEMKLDDLEKILLALCDSLGFEVVEERDFKENRHLEFNADRFSRATHSYYRRLSTSPADGDDYKTKLKVPIITYTLVKKDK